MVGSHTVSTRSILLRDQVSYNLFNLVNHIDKIKMNKHKIFAWYKPIYYGSYYTSEEKNRQRELWNRYHPMLWELGQSDLTVFFSNNDCVVIPYSENIYWYNQYVSNGKLYKYFDDAGVSHTLEGERGDRRFTLFAHLAIKLQV